MYNYYEELGINPKWSNEDIGKHLFEQKKKWINRQNAPDMKKRQQAEAKIALIEEAANIFNDKFKRKEYDAKLEKARKSGKVEKQQATTQYEKQEYEQNTSNTSAENEIIVRAKRVYDLGDSAATINFCKKAIADGYFNSDLFNYMALAYWEDGNVRMAIDTYKKGIQQFPDAAILYGNLAYVYACKTDDSATALSYIKKALELNSESSFFKATEIRCLLLTKNGSNVSLADSKVDEYLENNPNDQEYRQAVSDAYLAYANSWFLQSETGASYIINEDIYEYILMARKRAEEIYSTDYRKEQVKKVEKLNKKKFNTSNLLGLFMTAYIGGFSSLVYADLEMSKMLGVLIGIVAAVAFVVIVKFSFIPKWKLDYYKAIGKKDVVGWICWILALPLKFVWWIIKFAFNVWLYF